MSSNGSTIADENGDFEDWIEITNYSLLSVNLSGWYISDDLDNPTRWMFPAVTLEGGATMLIWASGKDRTNPNNPLHTNFSISADGEPLILTRADGTTQQVIEPVRLPRDVSYGFVGLGDSGSWFYYTSPTPGEPNRLDGYSEFMNAPEFSHASGFYSEGFNLEIFSDDPDAIIVYSIDGTIPEEEAIQGIEYNYKDFYPQLPGNPVAPLLTRSITANTYQSPISIDDRSSEADRMSQISTTFEREYIPGGSNFTWSPYKPETPVFKGTVVRAKVIKEGALPSPVVTKSYFISPDGSDRFDLPVVSLAIQEDHLFDYNNGIYVPGVDFDNWRQQSPGATPNPGAPANYNRQGRNWEYPVHFEYFGEDGDLKLSQAAGFRLHGGWSLANPRKSFRLYARNSYSESTFAFPFFDNGKQIHDGSPITEFHRLILRNGGNAGRHLHDIISHELMRPAKVGVQLSQPVVHFINGEYWGLMFLRDRIDRFYVADRYGVEADEVIMIDSPNGQSNPNRVEEGLPTDIQFYREIYNYAVNNNMNQPGRLDYIKERLDLDSYMDYIIMFVYLNNSDWAGNKHFRFWRVRNPGDGPFEDGRFRLIVWDFDSSPGLNVQRDMLERVMDPAGATFGNPGRTALFLNLMQNDEFKRMFINRLASHMNATFDPDRVRAITDHTYNKILSSIPEHMHRWNMDPGSADSYAAWHEFADQRTTAVRSHMHQYFNLGSDVEITLDLAGSRGGVLMVDNFAYDGDWLSFPLQCVYHDAIPLVIRALPQEGHRFVGWKEFPTETSDQIVVSPEEGMIITAVFEPYEIIHYWNFNDVSRLLEPTYTLGGSGISVELSGQTQVEDGGGDNGFIAVNAMFGDPVGRHLRINNPIGSFLNISLASQGYHLSTFSYETRRSGQGAGIQVLSYTTDGVTYFDLGSLVVNNSVPQLISFDLAAIEGVHDNPDFAIRIAFQEGAGGIAGNNRFDNMLLTGLAIDDASRRWNPTTFTQWQYLMFADPIDRENEEISGPFADPNRPGFHNLLHYALGVQPNSHLEDFAPEIMIEGETGYLSFPFSSSKSDIRYQVSASSSLEDWILIFDSGSQTPVFSTDGKALVSDPIPWNNNLLRRFLRLDIRFQE